MNARIHATIGMLLLVAILLSSITGENNFQASASVPQFPVGSGSWNPRISCPSPWIVRITDITDNMTGSASQSNSIFSPGITSPVGAAKRWLTPGGTPPGWVSPGPPCTITNSHGTVAVFVEIDGVKRTSISNEDCTGNYDPVNGGSSNGASYCDSTFNVCDPAVVASCSSSCTSSTDPTCFGKIHSEIDHDWKAAAYCGSSTTCDDVALGSQTTISTLIDFQGFISWDPGNLNQAWHSFNGWEIHPMTAWRVHQSNPALLASLSFSPSSPTIGQTITFTASASGGTSPYTFSWAFGDGSTGTGFTTSHAYATAGSYTVLLTAMDSGSPQQTATSQQSITVTNSAPPSLTANFTFSPSTSQTNQQVTFSGSASGGTTPYSFSWTFGDGSTATGSAVTHAYSSAGTFTIVLTVKDTGSPQQTATSQQSITVTNQPQPLSASFTYTPSSPGSGQQVTFTASASGGTSPYSFSWNFGDGSSATGSPATHVYSASGSYTVTLTTSDLGGNTTVVSKNVALSTFDFKLAANPYLLAISRGQNSQSQIAVTSVGVFQGKVTLAPSVSPPGVTVSMQNPSVTLSIGQTVNDNLKVSVSKTAPTGVYVVTVTGTSGPLIHSLNVTVRVPDFSMTANPVTLSIAPGSTGSSQIQFQSINGFHGGISTTVSVNPAGLTATLNPNNPSIIANGTTTSVLNIQVASNQAPGVYNVTIRATSGSLVHLLVLQVHVGQHSSTTIVNCSPSSVVVNQAFMCNAIVNDTGTSPITTPTGTVTFAETGPAGSFSSTTCTLASGTCSVTFTPRAAGNALVGSTYGGDPSHGGSTSASASITVNLRVTSISVVCSSPVLVNQASTCTATVSDTSPGTTITPTGSVAFNETGAPGSFSSPVCTLVSGSCSVTFTAAATGTAVVVGAYGGDLAHNASTSAAANVTINRRNTSSVIVCTNPVVVNQASNCTATITDSSGGGSITPIGNVTFVSDSSGSFSTATCTVASVSSGVARCSVSYTPNAAGNHLITASYNGDTIHFGSNGNSTVTVGLRATGTIVSCASTGLGVDEVCTATVTDNSPEMVVTPVGSVSFTTNSTGIFDSRTCNLSGTGTPGVASCQVTYTPVAVATHAITGSYSGDTIHSTSQGSASIGFGKDSTTSIVTCSPSAVTISQATVCTVTVNDTATIGPTSLTGTVSFVSSGAGTFAGSPCTLVNQTATSSSCQLTYTPTSDAGTHSITVTYNGDAIHNGSTSSQAFSISVTLRTTSTTVSCSPSIILVNEATICTAAVIDPYGSGGPTPTGNVLFTPGGSCTLVNASCSVSIIPSSPGSFSVSASYIGDSIHSGSQSSQPFSVSATLRTTTTTVSCSPSRIVVNQATNCTAVVVDSSGSGSITPAGNVVFTPRGSCTLISGSCSITITPSTSGSFSVNASYAGDSSHSTSSGGASVVVGNRSTSASVSCSPSPVTNGTATSCIAIVTDTDVGSAVTPSGSVGFASNSTGVLAQPSCTLAATGTVGVASCSVSYTPGTIGFHAIAASYSGDSSHLGSNGSVTLSVVGSAPKPAYALVISNDGRVSRLYQNGTLTLIGQPVTTALRSVAWKPDGSYALISGDSAVLLMYDGTTLTTIPTGISTGFNFWTVSWNPDGSYALIGGTSGTLFKYDGVKVTIIPNTSTTILSINWQPSGSYALLVGKVGLALTYDGTTVRSFVTGSTFDLDTAAWNPNGAYALIGGLNRTLLQFNGTRIAAINTSIIPPSNAIRAISFNQAGTMALLAGDGGMVLTWNGSTLTMLPTLTSSWLYSISWSPSGTAYIVGGSGTVLTYTNGTLSKLATSPVTTTQYRGITWKPQ